MNKFKINIDENGLWRIKYKGILFYREFVPKTFETSIDALQYLAEVCGDEMFKVDVDDNEENLIDLWP